MSKLADAQLAADGKLEQDKDRELRVAEMENAIERAMDARRAAQRSGAFNSSTGGAGSLDSPESVHAKLSQSQAIGSRSLPMLRHGHTWRPSRRGMRWRSPPKGGTKCGWRARGHDRVGIRPSPGWYGYGAA